jgi:hypothetical protein
LSIVEAAAKSQIETVQQLITRNDEILKPVITLVADIERGAMFSLARSMQKTFAGLVLGAFPPYFDERPSQFTKFVLDDSDYVRIPQPLTTKQREKDTQVNAIALVEEEHKPGGLSVAKIVARLEKDEQHELRNMWVDDSLSVEYIANRLGYSKGHTRRLARVLGLGHRKPGAKKVGWG